MVLGNMGEDMNEDLMEFGRRAVAATKGRIMTMPGARLYSEDGAEYWRIYQGPTDEDTRFQCHAIGESGGILRLADTSPNCGLVPDLSDPATVGCLLASLREAGGIIHKQYWRKHGGFTLLIGWLDGRPVQYKGGSLAAALVAALEAAP